MSSVSILLPVYNGAAFLEAAIESALAQSFKDFELLIVDDCSTDGSYAIIEAMKQRDPRIKSFINETNQGLFANYNRCLSLAEGRYIKPFAQDDILAQDCLKRMFDVLERDPSVVLVSSARNITDADGTTVETKCTFPGDRKVRGEDVILYNLIVLSNWVGEPSTVMYRAQFSGTGFDTNCFHLGDIDMWFNVLKNGDYYFISEALASFRRHNDNATNSNLSGLLFALDAVYLGKKYRQILEAFGESEDHYLLRVAEYAAMQVDHLVSKQGLTVEDVLSASVRGARIGKSSLEQERKILSAFVELNFVMMRSLTHTLSKLSDVEHRSEAEKAYLQRQLESIRASTSWKLTAPIREIMGKVKP